MAVKPNPHHDLPIRLKVRPYVYKRVLKACSETQEATPELKDLLAKARDLNTL